jgi:uncharacterized protein YhjY with autotransporter beta-barrel domain
MEPQISFNFVVISMVAVLGWFARELWSTIKEVKTEFNDFKSYIQLNYVNSQQYKDDINEIKRMVEKISDKM